VKRSTSGKRVRRRVVGVAGAFVLLVGPWRGGAAQSPAEIAAACAAAGGLAEPCAAAALTGRALMGQVGLLAGGGAEIPGTASTLGTRVGGGPRLSFFARGAALDAGLPDLGTATGAELGFAATALQAGVAAGLFDGFRLMPTVGGFLSADAFAQASFLFLPASEGFGGNAQSLTAGVRVGILREGFSVPGVSVTAARRFPGEVDFGPAGVTRPAVTVGPGVTSLRAVAGKDLLAVELMGGVGWDDYSGEATLRVLDDADSVVITTGELSGSRRLYFGSAAMTFGIVLSLSVQVGWADGFDPVAAYAGSFDPASGTLFGWLSARLTL
jgi:hypothetical protein